MDQDRERDEFRRMAISDLHHLLGRISQRLGEPEPEEPK